MYRPAHVGQRVVCVNVRFRSDGLHPYQGEVMPKKGGIYTVREVFDAGRYGYEGEDGLLLAEVVNPVRHYIAPAGLVECEQFWLDFRFRPLRWTNIDVFTAMLAPAPKEPADLIDA
jgi:hypothetical protein